MCELCQRVCELCQRACELCHTVQTGINFNTKRVLYASDTRVTHIEHDSLRVILCVRM